MELTESIKSVFIETAQTLKGSVRRRFMARVVQELGAGGQRLAQRELGWNRATIRKGTPERSSGVPCAGAYRLRGRKPAEASLPNLREDLKQIVEGQSQTDPQFRNNRLYPRLTAKEVRRQLILQKGYGDEELPQAETIGEKLNHLGYYPKKVKKSLPQKRSPQPTPSSRT